MCSMFAKLGCIHGSKVSWDGYESKAMMVSASSVRGPHSL